MLKKEREREEMASKLDDLENRSRRNNLVFHHGIPEVPKEICENTINEMLVEFVGLSPTSYQIERCHRTPSSPTPATEKEKRSPRIIHVAFATFAAKRRYERLVYKYTFTKPPLFSKTRTPRTRRKKIHPFFKFRVQAQTHPFFDFEYKLMKTTLFFKIANISCSRTC